MTAFWTVLTIAWCIAAALQVRALYRYFRQRRRGVSDEDDFLVCPVCGEQSAMFFFRLEWRCTLPACAATGWADPRPYSPVRIYPADVGGESPQ